MNDNDILTDAFRAAGEGYGYEEVTAEFVAFKDFKVRWSRSHVWARFYVSDYLMDAPSEVLTSIADTLFRKINGDITSGYGEAVTAWLTSDRFVEVKQPLFIRRTRGLGLGTAGEQWDLADSYRRLVDSGLVKEDPLLFMGWNTRARGGCVGRSSVLMRTIAMSSRLDTPEVSRDAMDYALYSQICHIALGFRPDKPVYCPEYDDLLALYPGRQACEEELLTLGLSP